MAASYGTDAMPETADNVAADYDISRADQDAFALRSQQRWAAAEAEGVFRDEIAPVAIPQRKGAPVIVDRDETSQARHHRRGGWRRCAASTGPTGP